MNNPIEFKGLYRKKKMFGFKLVKNVKHLRKIQVVAKKI